MALAQEARSDAEPGQAYLASGMIHQDVRGLDILVDEAALVKLANRSCNGDRELQEARNVHRRPELPLERFIVRILEHQHGSAGLAHELQRPCRPRRVELILQFVFMREMIET